MKLVSQYFDEIALFLEQNIMDKIASNQQISIADELKKFKELLDSGAITQEEFEMQKAKLLK